MNKVEELADKLAEETLELVKETGDESIPDEISQAIGASSMTMQEAYLTAIRYRRAEARGRAALIRLRPGLKSLKSPKKT